MTTHPAARIPATDVSTAPGLDVTVLLPCRNEERTVGLCVTSALLWISMRDLSGEVLVVDNGSTDASAANARTAGARVLHEANPGYGNALHAGIRAAHGTVIIMADADNTYDLSDLDQFYDPIAIDASHDFVVGNRFAGRLDPRAMSGFHRVGNFLLSRLTRIATGCDVLDVHCGLRAFSRAAMSDLPPWSTGMEFATHTVAHAHHTGMRIGQTPTTLRPAVDGRTSHIRPLRDGLRHLAAIARATNKTLRLRAG